MLSQANIIIEKNLDTQIEDELSFLQNRKNSLSLKESILNQAIIGSTLYTPTDAPIHIQTIIATEAPTITSSNAPRIKRTRMPTANPTLEPTISTVSPTEEPTLVPSIESTVTPTFTPAPTSSPTREIVPAAGSVVQFKISKTDNCIEFLQIQIVSTAVEAIVVSSKGDIGVFWKCVESNGQVYYYNQSSTTELRRLNTAEYIEENSHQRQLAQIDFTIFVNVSRVLPKGSGPEVIIQTQQSLANDVNLAFINQTFAKKTTRRFWKSVGGNGGLDPMGMSILKLRMVGKVYLRRGILFTVLLWNCVADLFHCDGGFGFSLLFAGSPSIG
jgi:hypothetical protein